MIRVLALLLITGCAVYAAPLPAAHPANPAAPVGRIAGAPASLRPGVVAYGDAGIPPAAIPDPNATPSPAVPDATDPHATPAPHEHGPPTTPDPRATPAPHEHRPSTTPDPRATPAPHEH